MTVHVYHPYRQPNGTNHCSANSVLCTHLCLPAPQINNLLAHSAKISCACPTGLKLLDDDRTCIEDGNYYSKFRTEIDLSIIYMWM